MMAYHTVAVYENVIPTHGYIGLDKSWPSHNFFLLFSFTNMHVNRIVYRTKAYVPKNSQNARSGVT
jgi:hypothetical protein